VAVGSHRIRNSGQALASRRPDAGRTPVREEDRSENSLMITAASRTKRKAFAVGTVVLRQFPPAAGGELCCFSGWSDRPSWLSWDEQVSGFDQAPDGAALCWTTVRHVWVCGPEVALTAAEPDPVGGSSSWIQAGGGPQRRSTADQGNFGWICRPAYSWRVK